MLLYLLWLSLRYQTTNSNTTSADSMNYFTYFTSSCMLYFIVYNKSATFGIILSHAPWKGHSFWNLCVLNYYSFKHGVSTNHLYSTVVFLQSAHCMQCTILLTKIWNKCLFQCKSGMPMVMLDTGWGKILQLLKHCNGNITLAEGLRFKITVYGCDTTKSVWPFEYGGRGYI
jgi:hypothetical protein